MVQGQHSKKNVSKISGRADSSADSSAVPVAAPKTPGKSTATPDAWNAKGNESKTASVADATQMMSPSYQNMAVPAQAASGNASTVASGNDDYANLINMGGAKKSHKKLFILLGIIVGILVAVYIGFSIFFMSHFGFNTTIDNIDCSLKTVDQVESAISDQVDSYSLTIKERNNGSEVIKGSAIGLTYVSDGQVQKLLDNQQPFAWIARLFSKSSGENTNASVKYDETKLKSAIDALSSMNKSNMKAPADAYCAYNGTEYVVQAEDLGTTIDTTVIYDVIEKAVDSTATTVDLDSSGCYVNPTVYSTDESLQKTADTYNKYVNFSLTYTFGDNTEVLDGQTALGFLNLKSDGSATIDEDAVSDWVAGLASRHDTVGTERTFTGGDGNTYTISGGTYGWQIDQDAEKDAILSLLNGESSDKNQTREPYYTQTAASTGTPDFGNSYIDLNLTTQHMYLIIDGVVTFQSDVVTGLPTPEKITPNGVYDILDMQSPYTMHGDTDPATGEPSYVTTCSYFMRMTWTGVAFHDASWQSSFGGDRYTYAGSHGCINMPPENAATLYGLIWVGLPCLSHY